MTTLEGVQWLLNMHDEMLEALTEVAVDIQLSNGLHNLADPVLGRVQSAIHHARGGQ